MKKIIIFNVIIVVLSVFVYEITTRESLVEVSLNMQSISGGEKTSENKGIVVNDREKVKQSKESKNNSNLTQSENDAIQKNDDNSINEAGNMSDEKYINSENNVNHENSIKDNKVKIIVLNNNYTSIYHSNIKMSGENLTLYYGRKFEDKKGINSINVENDSSYFKNSDVIKIEAKDNIYWEKDSEQCKKYKGIFFIYKTSNGMVVVNQLDVEDYVAAVISSEMGESFPLEALKAQAVCARTYIINSEPKEYKKYNANADDSTAFQVYNRVEPGEKCKKAAYTTKNEIITYKGKPIKAYYFSTSCGYTTNYKIWGRKKLTYLKECCVSKISIDIGCENDFEKFIKSYPKAYENECPFYRWNVYVSKEQIRNSVYRATGENLGNICRIEVNTRGAGGIASQITIYGDKSQIVMTNQNQIRKVLISYYSEIKLNDGSVRNKMDMLPSAFIYIDNVYENERLCGFKIYGGGFGHGSGMSQNGAKAMAEYKMNYKQILKFFYDNVEIINY